MNAKAHELGLTDTHFENPDGLDAPGHYSSARDVTRLALVAMRSPLIRSIVRQPTASIPPNRTLHTWNDLLTTVPGVFGVKTGHTSGAGWSEVAAAKGRTATVYATILGGPTRARRNADLTELLVWGLSRYRMVKVIEPTRVYATALAPYGRKPLALGVPDGARRVVRVGRPLVERVTAPAVVSLPVRKGERLGEVRVYEGGELIARRPLVARRSIDAPGLLGRAGWYAKRTAATVWGWVS
jgi:D-alanyl-D-alanine carboxypeptidase (penicillin-binding protein 5/6)